MRVTFKALTAIAVCAGFAGLTAGSALAGSPYGNWTRPKNGAVIKVYKCGGGLGMKVVSSPNKKSVGKRMMCGADKTGTNKWEGDLTSPEDGNTYSGTVRLKGSRLKLTGCALGVFCKTESWHR